MNMQNNSRDRYIYIVFMITTTGIGKVIRTVTRHPYNHASLSLYPDLRVSYTFARLHVDAPFCGGFTMESLRRFPRDERTVFKVCRLALNEEEYRKLCSYLRPFVDSPDDYVYNILSAATHVFGHRFRLSKSYTCIEFVTDALRASGCLSGIPDFCSIEDLENLLADRVVYEGPALHYPLPESWCRDTYPERLGAVQGVRYTASNIRKMLSMAGNEKIRK